LDNKNYTDKKFWDEYFEQYQQNPIKVGGSFFSDIFDKYLKPDSNKSVLEIGCAGGNYLAYLAKTFGYKASGIDYSEAITRTADLFKFNGLPEPTLYKKDFFSWKPNIKFDVVCSFGFVEHFDNLNNVIARHANLVSPGGKIIITLPHFAHGQYLLHWLIDKDNLKKHNTKIMNLNAIKKAVENNDLKIEFLSYYKTFGFWAENYQMSTTSRTINWLIKKMGKAVNKIFGYDRPNFLFSPHIVCVAKLSDNKKHL